MTGDKSNESDRGPKKPRTRCVLCLAMRPAGRIHRIPIDPRRFDLKSGDLVVVETDRGNTMARVLREPCEMERPELSRQVRKVIRPAREPDLLTHAEGKAREEEMLGQVKEICGRENPNIQVVDIDFQGLGNKLTVFFIAEKRVDFRSLVRELSQDLKVRIEMRQIGVRDEAKLKGGIGHCGRELCCRTHLHDFCAVSIRMAKDQNLALSPNKISGLCGRLMCCLSYEHEEYAARKKGLPKAGKRVMTTSGPGKVLSIDILRQRMLFLTDEGTRVTVTKDDLVYGDDGLLIRPPKPEYGGTKSRGGGGRPGGGRPSGGRSGGGRPSGGRSAGGRPGGGRPSGGRPGGKDASDGGDRSRSRGDKQPRSGDGDQPVAGEEEGAGRSEGRGRSRSRGASSNRQDSPSQGRGRKGRGSRRRGRGRGRSGNRARKDTKE